MYFAELVVLLVADQDVVVGVDAEVLGVGAEGFVGAAEMGFVEEDFHFSVGGAD